MGLKAAVANLAGQVLKRLERAYPEANCALNFKSAFELLAATILSAQCTDERVNKVTPDLFRCYPNAEALAKANTAELENLIYSTGFFRAKAKALIGMATDLVARHSGKVPSNMAALVELPGVARKTANVVLGTAYGIPAGVVVDTHVKRLAGRLGLTRNTDPAKIEQDLMRLFPQTAWISLAHRLIAHGRKVCLARKPKCAGCVLEDLCPAAETYRAQTISKLPK